MLLLLLVAALEPKMKGLMVVLSEAPETNQTTFVALVLQSRRIGVLCPDILISRGCTRFHAEERAGSFVHAGLKDFQTPVQ
jgi:hypothetical protein